MSGQTTSTNMANDLSLNHLQVELTRIDLLLQRAIQCWRLAGQEPADNFRGLYVSDSEVDSLLARPLGGSWGETVVLPDDQTQAFTKAEAQLVQNIQDTLAAAKKAGQTTRLSHLTTVFGLNRFELDALLICLAPTLDLRYERVYGYLQDDVTRKRPTVNLIISLLAKEGLPRLPLLANFADDAPLFKYHLLEHGAGAENPPLLNRTLQVDETVVAWLLGHYQPHPDLGGHARLLPQPDLLHQSDKLFVDDIQLPVAQLTKPDGPPLIVFYGLDQVSQRAAARVLADHLNRSLLIIDMAAIVGSEQTPYQALKLALRDARLTGALPYLLGWDACLGRDGTLSAGLLRELCAYPELVIIAGQTAWQAEGIDRDRTLFRLEFPVPAYPQRLALWHHFLGMTPPSAEAVAQPNLAGNGAGPEPSASGWDLAALAGQFALTTGQIRDTVASAKDMAAQRNDPLTGQDLFLAARSHSNPRLATLARKITPRYGWQDIIVPADQRAILHEIVATVRGRPIVLEQWGVGQKLASSAAVTVLFAGDPGTGKTMAAEVIANELSLDLYKIDLSTVISKYIGETEKNLEKIFNEAESSNAILFFDEADSIFGKRSEVKDAHDRYANIEVSYLLQRMEAYDGVTILATNLRANLDEAFTRRLQFAVDFPFPEKEDRLRIWQTLFPSDVPREADLNFDLLAKRFKLAGGNIRNIIVSAAYQAAADGGQVTMAHLMHGTRRELQKMGRLIGEEDLRI